MLWRRHHEGEDLRGHARLRILGCGMERARRFVEHLAPSQNAWSLVIDCETDLPLEHTSDDEARMPVLGRAPPGRITDFHQ